MRGLGRAVFVAILLLIAGVLNVIYGFAAIGADRRSMDRAEGATARLWQ